MLIVRQGNQVFVSESFDLTTARKLQFLFFGAQQGGESSKLRMPRLRLTNSPRHLTRLMAGCGLMKASLLH